MSVAKVKMFVISAGDTGTQKNPIVGFWEMAPIRDVSDKSNEAADPSPAGPTKIRGVLRANGASWVIEWPGGVKRVLVEERYPSRLAGKVRNWVLTSGKNNGKWKTLPTLRLDRPPMHQSVDAISGGLPTLGKR